MKLAFIGVNDLAGVEADARFAAQHGFSGLEFNFWKPFEALTEETVVQMRAILDRYGVRCSALGLWGWNHISPDPEERRVSLAHLDRAIDFAQQLGASVLITGGGRIADASLEENVAEFVAVFPPYLEKAQNAGLRVALYAVHGNSFFDGIEAYEQVWAYLPEVGIKFDPANILHHGDDYLAILRDHAARIFYMHIKEHLYLDGKLVSQPAAGMGDIQWGKVMAFLYEAGYDGYLSFEPHGPLLGQTGLCVKRCCC
ncbi:MAG: sugar phosphate isomerase/epimerase [Caldilineaceae bacterium]|nr:sugar phosphate isomerase/epimerase [Caldilineaceae bacterium]